jgi:2-polyprenyl-3-methyl-5-hydroxy-6-metoxy-1,4-benzoquinol methylase
LIADGGISFGKSTSQLCEINTQHQVSPSRLNTAAYSNNLAIPAKASSPQIDQKNVAFTPRAVIDQYMEQYPPPQLQPGLPAAAYYSGEILTQPILCETLYYQRPRYIREFGFCLFSSECIDVLTSFCNGKRVLEAGSGTGWLAKQLALQGISITAADLADYSLPPDENRGYPMQTMYRQDYHGDALPLLPGIFDVVLLVWPNHNTPFAEQVARMIKSGQLLILVSEGKGGRIATDSFFEILSANFVLLEEKTRLLNQHHRTFPGLYDRWQVLRKK